MNNRPQFALYGAMQLAARKHGEQKRRYTGEPYTVHLLRVAQLCEWAGLSIETQTVAILHDVFEDTNCTEDEVWAWVHSPFLKEIVRDVKALTDTPVTPGMNRAQRKVLDRERLAQASASAQSVKCADIADNLPSIVEHDKDFARVVLPEVYETLKVLKKANAQLYELAYKEYLSAKNFLENEHGT